MAQMLHSLRDLGTVIRARRKLLGYTQEELAEANGMSPRFVGEVERGVAGAGFERVLKLANSVGIDLLAQERGEGGWR